jgi:hypothetical protein
MIADHLVTQNSSPQTAGWRMRFGTDAPSIEVPVAGGGPPSTPAPALLVWVDGQLVSDTSTTAATDNAPHYIKVPFGSRADRNIVIEASDCATRNRECGYRTRRTN